MRARTLGCVAAGLLAASCGGSSKQTATTMPTSETETPVVSDGESGTMESAEALDGINRALDRKRPMAARCLSEAVDRKEFPSSSHGKMTLGFSISADGKASNIKVIKSTLESEQLAACVIAIVERITFPSLQASRDWSYTYAFEAM
ncbi:MAG TPA: AgmX/PglI C-terminal domain-containing protein [Kofleriaceae bacterium]|nr:AgmX/PglI C-terminal domain-containing protein [Kofleriaceae bacterium]